KEIEGVISGHSGVREVAVFGIPDDVWGESVCAAIVKKQGAVVDEASIVRYCAARLSSYKKPRKVVFLEELPKNAFGKVTKNVLREPYWRGREKQI
ncbi:MAG: hypothetical protein JRH15_21685, partial [Deltaproteobacteria bacterium]|nr:hypothetical protein [Deltaproteobacteria bacterium]